MLTPIKNWDDEFANMAYIPGADVLPDVWVRRAAAYRESGVQIETDMAYGDHPREAYDLIWPDIAPKGLVVFIHGGYWLALDKSSWTDLAEGARANGWAVCIPSYTLAPEARIGHMTVQIAHAIEHAAKCVNGPIRITGHSAGGHLATRMICGDTNLSRDILARLAAVQSISGVHDLRPLLHTKMNDVLGLDLEEAMRESPVLHNPVVPVPYRCWVGGAERPEFIRQSQIMAQIWSGLDTPATCVIDGQHHHFSVIDGLRNPYSDITRNLLK